MAVGALVYFGGGTLLFFFWVYGIAAFARDVRRRYLPAIRRFRAARRESKAAAEREAEREERERQLY